MQTLTIEKLRELVQLTSRCLKKPVLVAGGAPRDILHNKPVRDIDIFVPDYYSGSVKSLISALRCVDVVYAQFNASNEYSKQGLRMSWLVTLPTGFHMYPIQLIAFAEEPIEVVKQFDFGLCQVWIDGRRLGWTQKYSRDHDNQRMTYQENDGRSLSRKRLLQLQEKYPPQKWSYWNLPPEMSE